MKRRAVKLLFGISAILLMRCVQPAPQSELWRAGRSDSSSLLLEGAATPQAATFLPPTRAPGELLSSPTPDAPHILPTTRINEDAYTLQAGDTLGKVANKFQVSLEQLVSANQISNPNLVQVGQQILIPVPSPQAGGPPFKIIPDSELVFGPASTTLDVFSFIKGAGGYLSTYREEINSQTYTGAEIILKVSREYSVNPRLLLAILEYQSQWLTDISPADDTLEYPLRYFDSDRSNLYRQLSWAANELNRGYTLWKIGGMSHFSLSDNGMIPANPTINAGTAGVQWLMAKLTTRPEWDAAVSETGVHGTYLKLFGYPFDLRIEPLLPMDLYQPEMQLPFEEGEIWSFTGGPHAGWGDGSGWAAIDFAPPGGGKGCIISDAWVTAVADGPVIRSELGVVVQDLDGDGLEQTGWTVLYLHISSSGRVQNGTDLKAGDRIGHPSCEGGVSNGTHVHLARRYNGEWISADGSLPFVLDGWVSQGTGVEYNGTLNRNDAVVEAWDRLVPQNQISR